MFLNEKICVIAADNSVTSDNRIIDYIKLASIAAERVRYFLNLPTCLITTDFDEASKYNNFKEILIHPKIESNKRFMIAGKSHIEYNWLNDTRVNVYNFTKGLAKKILMIDADYMMASDQFVSWLNNDYPFLILNNAYDISNSKIYNQTYLPSNDIIQRWATVMCWEQSEESKVIFDTAKMVRDNYEFYALMFNFPKFPFRNDLAFSVACHLHHVPCTTNKLFNLSPAGNIYQSNDNKWIIDLNNKVFRWDNDIHVLNKEYAIDNTLMNVLRLQNVKA